MLVKKSISPLFKNFGCIISQGDTYKNLMDLRPAEIKPLLPQFGVVLFRGFDVNVDNFKTFTDAFSQDYLIHLTPDLRPTVGEDRTITGVLKGNDVVYLHGEMYYMPVRPEFLWLLCMVPPAKRGETTVCNSETFLSNLSPSTRSLFEKKRIMYCHTATEMQWKNGFGVKTPEQVVEILKVKKKITDVQIQSDNTITFQFKASAIKDLGQGKRGFINSIANMSQYDDRVKVLFEDGSEIPQNVLSEIINVGERTAQDIKWQSGDLVLVDNSWILHGRRAFEGTREILTRFSNAA